jgi:cytochrome P450
MGVLRAITHDEKVYPRPFDFNPDRFMGPKPNPDPDVVFGFGRSVPETYCALL